MPLSLPTRFDLGPTTFHVHR